MGIQGSLLLRTVTRALPPQSQCHTTVIVTTVTICHSHCHSHNSRETGCYCHNILIKIKILECHYNTATIFYALLQ
jgi:hypothetical protein